MGVNWRSEMRGICQRNIYFKQGLSRVSHFSKIHICALKLRCTILCICTLGAYIAWALVQQHFSSELQHGKTTTQLQSYRYINSKMFCGVPGQYSQFDSWRFEPAESSERQTSWYKIAFSVVYLIIPYIDNYTPN